MYGTVREQTDEKLGPVKEGFGKHYDQLKVLTADLMIAETIDNAIKVSNCDYIIHTACPYPTMIPKDIDFVVEQAVEGTKAIMKGAYKYGVKRVVLTSSYTAMEDFNFEGDDDVIAEEDCWNDIHKRTTWNHKSKALSERYAWDFYDKLDEEEKKDFELVTILPGITFGPLVVKRENLSKNIISG